MHQDERASVALLSAQVLRDHLDQAIDEGVRRTLELRSYAGVSPEELRPNVVAGFHAVADDLENPEACKLGGLFANVGRQRALQKFNIADVMSVVSLSEDIVKNILYRHVEEPTRRLLVNE